MWAPLQRELIFLGHRSFAVDLPGHGFDAQYPAAYQAPQDLDAWAVEPSTLAGVSLQTNIDMVVDVVRRVAKYGPVVLVAPASEEPPSPESATPFLTWSTGSCTSPPGRACND